MKVIKWIAGATIWAGLIFMLGTFGSGDLDLICFDVLVFRAMIALAMVVVGFTVCYVIEKKEREQ